MNKGPGAINRIYRLVWRDAIGAYVAVAEFARGHGKRSSAVVGAVLAIAAIAATSALAAGPPATNALPTGAAVSAGQASISQSGNQLTILQSSTQAAINWQSFNIGAQAQVNFSQPSAASVALNRVMTGDPSAIYGRMSANGQVILVNPSGIVFGPGSQVDVGGLVASSLNISDTDFMNGRLKFFRESAGASVVNQGALTAKAGGYIALLSQEARNEGVLTAKLGTVAMAAGDAVTLDISGTGLLGVKVDPASVSALVENRNLIQVDGGTAILSAGAANRLVEQAISVGGASTANQLVTQDGVLRLVSSAAKIEAAGGAVLLEGSTVDTAGIVNVSASKAGSISVRADFINQSGQMQANSDQGQGGHIALDATTVMQTASTLLSADGATAGGSVSIQGGHTGSTDSAVQGRIYSSANLSARGTGANAEGGSVSMTADSVQLRAVRIDASGTGNGGSIRIGGGFQGADSSLANALELGINASSSLRADAGERGDGGTVVVWSDNTTLFAGQVSATGGALGGNGGQAEISGKGNLAFTGKVDLSGAHGGSVLFDPRNIIIDDASSALATLDLADPTPSSTNGFGTTTKVLSGGNVLITAPNADTGSATATGAVYLFDTKTGALLSNLRGSYAGDKISSAGIYTLSNGNYLVLSPNFYTQASKNYFSKSALDATVMTDALPHPSAYAITAGSVSSGAITWQSGAGTNGGAANLVGTSNSLVGSTGTDSVSTYNGKNVSTGSATVTANDQLGKLTYFDAVNYVSVPGTTAVYALTDGNVVVGNPYAYNGRGSATWINASNGQLRNGAAGGAISATVSLVGSTPIRSVAVTSTDSSSHTVYVLDWASALPYTETYNGSANSPIRSNAPGAPGDFVGQSVVALAGGNYAVASPQWTNGAYTYAGAVTYGASGGATGTVATSNSLYGDRSFDFVGSGGIVPVGTGGANYLVDSPLWAATGNAAAGKFLQNNPNGAVTWVNGSNGLVYGAGATGVAVAIGNSLVGAAGDALGSKASSSSLTSYSYDYNTTTYNTTYPYAASRMTQGDVANGLVTLTNGNYLVVDTTSGGSAGSVTFGLGATGMAGQMSSANSLVGSTGGDLIGTTVIPLSASNYVAYSPTWTHPTGTKINAGAVTWGSASSGVLGAVSSANSLVGSDAYEAVGSGGVITVGAMGSDGLRPHYLVLSPQWGNRASVQYTTAAFGAVTWVDGSNGHAFGAAGAGAALSSSNSLVGSLAGDYVGSYNQSNSRMTTSMGNDGASRIDSTWYANLTPTVDLLTNGNFVVRSPSWSAGKGAVTWGNGTTGLAGAVGSSNSLVGSTSDVYTTATSSRTANAQAYTDTTYNLTTTGDHVGLLGSTLNDGNFLTISPSWGNGRGALTWLGASSVGTVGTANSLLGSTQDIFSATNHNQLVSAGDRLGTLADSTWVTPTVSVRNSDGYTTTATRNLGPYQFGISSDVSAYTGSVYIKVGQNYGTQSVAVTHFVSDGYGGLSTNFAFNSSPIVSQLSNGNVLIGSASWNNTAATAAGAVTWLNGANGHYADGSSGGTLSGANSLLASHTNDNLGYALPVGGVVELSNGNYVLVNPQWNSERGAVTWGSGTAGVVGTVSSANSLVGNTASGSIAVTVGYHPTTGYTAYRYVQGLGWVGAWVDKNSDLKGDQIGRGGVFALADGNFVVSSPFWSTDPTAAATTVLPASYGAATWVNGTNGQLIGASSGGLVSASNSLVGSQYGDAVSYAVWDLYGPQSLGSTPASAPLSISSTPAYSYIMPGVAVLAGGRYAVASPYWANGSAAQAGAVTFVAAGGAVGAVGTSNSLTGSTANDHVGRGQATDVYDAMIGWYIHTWTPGVITLSNASYTNYVVRSADWTNTNDVATGGAAAGAMTWVDGSNGHAYGDSSTAATVNQANSLVGNLAGNAVGQTNISLQRTVGNAQVATGDLLSLSNAAYCAAGAGSITLIPGATGIAGPISWRNSVVGLASSSAGLQTTTWDSYSNYLSDVQYAMLPTAVTASEQVQYRPLVWVTPDATSGANATHAMALTVVGQSTTTPNTADLVNTAGNLNWTSDKLAATSAEFTALGGSAGLMAFSASTGGDVVMTPAALTDMLNAGTNVTLQASNNITVLKAVTSSAAGTGGSLTLEAGRSVTIQANITTDNGNFSATTNKGVASGVVDADCSVCVAQIVMAPGTSINAGTGDVNLTVLKSTDKTSNAAANMVLDDLYGAHIAVVNQGLDSSNQGVGIRFNAATVIGTSATQSVVLKAGGSSATGAGIVLASDTLIRGANAAQLQVAAADTAGVVGFDAAGAGFSMTAAEVGSVIQQSSGFANISLGRSDQSGATALTGMNFTAAAMLRGASTLPVNVSVLAGSGGLGITGTLTSGEASANQFELSVTNGVLALGTSSVAASTGVFKLSALGSGSVTKGAGTFNISQLLLNGTGAFGLTAGTNTIGTLAGNVGSAQVKTSASSLTVGSVGGLDGITAATGLLLQAAGASSDVVLNQAVGSAAGDSVLIAARNFTNNLASDTGILPGTGRYLVYSTNPANSLEGMGTYSKHYAQSYTGTMPAYASSGNWFLYSLAPTLSASVSGGSTITYGASGSTPSVNITGYIDGDTFASATAGSLNTSLGAYTPSNAGYIPVGSYTISLTGVGTLTSPLGYQVSATTGSSTLAVQAKALAVTGLSANGKVYDGTVSTTVTGTAALAGAGATSSDGKFLTSDLVSLSGTATGSFADKNYGLGKSVTLSGLSLSGADAANYVISSNSVTADITRKTLTVSGLSTVASKVYDGNTNAAVSGTAALLAGETAGSGNSSDGRFYTGDTVSLTGTATGSYNSKDVASATTVTLTGMTLSGAAANNYTLGSQAATITPKSVSASGISASNREYDAGVSVGLTGSAGLTGGGLVAGDGKYINGDSISVNGTANGSFASAGVANGKTVTLTGLSLGGSDSGNYALNAYTTTANVTARQLVISADNQSKVYGDTDPSLTYTIGGSGLANGEQASSVLSGAISTAAGSSATAGTHAITQGNLASHSNYSIATFNSGNLTVSKATLSVTADDRSKVYGDTDPTLSYTVNAAQLKYTDTSSVVNGVSLSTDTGAAATAGNHTITASGGTAANYSINAVNGNLTVSKATLSVTADDRSKVYGDTDPTLSYTVNAAQLKYTDTSSVVSAVGLGTDTGAAATAGNHTITASGGTAANYSINAVNGNLSVSKATLSVTADDQSKVYGDTDPTLSYTVNAAQLKYTDTGSVVNGVSLSTDTGAAATAGNHTITASGGTAANYSISAANGNLTVSKATLNVTADDKAKVYGDSDPALSYTVNAAQLKYTDTGSVANGVSLSADTGAAATAGNHAITASGGTAANYSINAVNGNLTVSKATLSVTIDDKAKVYGDTDPNLSYTVNQAQLKYTDTSSVVSSMVLVTDTGAAATAGNHSITASGATAANYSISAANGNLTVSKATLSVTIDDKAKVYGDTDPTLSYTVNAAQLKYTDTSSVVSAVGLGTDTGAAATAGNHTITASGGTAANYSISAVNGKLSVSKASLAVTADDQSKVYGDTDPTLSYTVNAAQLKYTDTGSVVSAVSLGTDTGAAATAGNHAITASGGTAANYSISAVNGKLTVSKATLSVTIDDKSKVYGDTDPTLSYTVNAAQLKYTDTSSVVSAVGLGTDTGAAATAGNHSITASGGTAANYSISAANGNLTVSKASLSVTADDQSKVYGDTDPTLSYTVNAAQLKYTDTGSVVNGVSLSADTGAAATAGNHSITASGGTAANYSISAANGNLTVSKASLSVTADDQSKVYGDTDPALSYTVNAAQLKYTETGSVVNGVSLSADTGAAATAGNHAITASGGTAANYSISAVNGNLTVSKATLNVTADDKSKVYGDTDPALSYTVNQAQLKYTDSGNVVNGVSLSADTGAAATAGNHVITASGGTAANYSISAVNGKLSVSKASLSVTADDKAKVYGDTDPTLSYTVNAAQLKYTDSGSVVNGVSLSADTGAAATAGSHAITVSGGAAANYSISAVNGKLSVSKATLNVTADDKRKNVGEPDPAFTYQVNAAQLRYADTTAVVSGVIAKPLTGGSLIPADYPIVATSGLSANYVLSYVDGIFKVKATPSVNAEGLSVSSGQSVGAPSAPATAAVATGNAQPGQLSVVGGGISVPASSLGTGTGTSTSTSTSTSASTSTSTVSGATPDSGTSTGSTSTGASSSGGERSAGTGAANNAPLATAVQQTFAAVISAGSSITVQTVKAFQIPAGETVRYFATQQNQEPMPSWLVIDPTSGVMSGTPPKGGPETITVTVTATDEAGRKATATFTLTGTPG